MVDRISRIYTGLTPPLQPPEKPKKSEKTSEVDRPVRSGPIAARLIPDLVDKVEISEAGRMAAAQISAPKESKIPDETIQTIRSSWYAVGYTAARSDQDSA
ncbi:MAG: hypothetical protein V2A56_09170 [bacterium]